MYQAGITKADEYYVKEAGEESVFKEVLIDHKRLHIVSNEYLQTLRQGPRTDARHCTDKPWCCCFLMVTMVMGIIYADAMSQVCSVMALKPSDPDGKPG